MDDFESKRKRYRKHFTKLGGKKVLGIRSRAAMFLVSFVFLNYRALSRGPSGGRQMPRAVVRVRAQASHGNITVLSYLKISLFEMCLQRIMVAVFIIFDWIFVLMNTTTMIPNRHFS